MRKKNRPIMLMGASVALVIALAFLVMPVPIARAATLTVTNANDSGVGSLRDTILSASSGDSINFASDYTIVLSSPLAINQPLTIDGSGHNIIVSGNSITRVFEINYGIHAALNALTITNGYCNTCDGAGVWNNGTLTVTNSTVVNNSAPASGGGGLSTAYTAKIVNSTFAGNSSISGGAVWMYDGALSIQGSTFFDNLDSERAGAMVIQNGTVTITNTTFSTNLGGEVGAILIYTGTLATNNTTFGDNLGTSVDTLHNISGTATLRNTLISGPYFPQCYGTLNSAGYNLSTDYSCSFTQPTDHQFAYSLLAPLGNYGGATQTRALLPGSAAINAGNNVTCATQDQRGIARPQQGTCDIGAFESRGFTAAKVSGDNQSTRVEASFPAPLVLSVFDSNDEPVSGGQVRFIGPTSGASISPTLDLATIGVGGTTYFTPTANSITGTYTVNAAITGTTGVITFTLTNIDTRTDASLVVSPLTSVFGQMVTFTATVTSPTGTPIGTVTFKDAGANIAGCINVATSNGQAFCSTAQLTAGSHNLEAFFYGAFPYDDTISDTVAQTVSKANTTTSILNDTPDPSQVSLPFTVTFSVNAVAPGGGTPTGNITVTDGTVQCVGSVASGNCWLTPTSLGVKTLTATFGGDANFNSSVSSGVSHTVNSGSLTITSISPISTTVGGVQFTLAVTGTGFVNGSVVRWNGADRTTNYLSATRLTATILASDIANAGTANVNVFNSATSDTSNLLLFTIDKANTTTTVTSSPNPSMVGQTVVFTATVTSAIGTPTGTVTFQDNSVNVSGCVNVALVSGQATCATQPSAGTHSIVAYFNGSSNYNTSASPIHTQTVNAPASQYYLPFIRK